MLICWAFENVFLKNFVFLEVPFSRIPPPQGVTNQIKLNALK